MNTIKNDSKIGYKAKQDNENTSLETEEHADLHVSSNATSLLSAQVWPVCNEGITQFYMPPTPYLPLLPSCKALPPFGWLYSLRSPTKGWPGWV